ESAECNKCGRTVNFPAAPGSSPAAETPPGGVPVIPGLLDEGPAPAQDPAGQAPPGAAGTVPAAPRRGWDAFYWGLLLALLPLVIGVLMAWRAVSPWLLALAGLFTATFGIACLFLLQDFVGQSSQATLDPEENFLSNLIGFIFLVGLGEELCKSLPVIFYVR